jgi:hypothetical protein
MLSQPLNTEIIFVIAIWFVILLLFVTMVVSALVSIFSEQRAEVESEDVFHEKSKW